MLIELNAADSARLDLAIRQPMLCADIPALREGKVGVQYWSLRLVRDNGGVVHVNFIRPCVSPQGQAWEDKRATALRELRARLVDQASIDKAIAAWEKSVAPPRADISDVADHIDHIRKVAGADRIGIGADFYHADESDMATGLGNVTRYPHLFAELLRRRYSEEDALKIAGRNHLRAMRQMEKVAAELQRTEPPLLSEMKQDS